VSEKKIFLMAYVLNVENLFAFCDAATTLVARSLDEMSSAKLEKVSDEFKRASDIFSRVKQQRTA
jgi:hypothetical protein